MMRDNKKMLNRIINHNKYIWENSISKKDLEEWFNNFRGKAADTAEEREIARDLVLNFIYYNEKEIKYLCKSAYIIFQQRRIRELVLKRNSIDTAYSLFNRELKSKKYRFSHIGRASESGGYILYLFRQINELPLYLFFKDEEEINSDVSSLIFVDDFFGTGQTAVDFWNSQPIQNIAGRFPSIKLYYMALAALKKGVDNVEKYTNFKVICPEIFDEEYRVFSDKSFIFPEKKKRESAKQVCKIYGEDLEGKKYALGYKDSEALIGFHHNIPNNTLPIIWSDKKRWFPLFSRERKIYK